jgi:hypothetical protein
VNGFNVAESGHLVQLITPQNITTTTNSQCFNFGKAEHVSIILQLGAITTAPVVTVQAFQTAAAALANTGGIAMPFRYYASEGPGGTTTDISSPPIYGTSSGFTPSKINNSYVIIEMDSAEIDFLPGTGTPSENDSDSQDYPFLTLLLTSGSLYCSAVMIASGVRQQFQAGGLNSLQMTI